MPRQWTKAEHRALVELHNWKLECCNKRDRRTKFQVTLTGAQLDLLARAVRLALAADKEGETDGE